MKYYVRVILENGLISPDVDIFSTMEEAKIFKHLTEKAGNKATIYEIQLVPVTEEQHQINPELMDLVKQANSATFEIPEVAVPFTAVMNPEILKAYSDGNIQGYHQGFQDGKKKGSIMHDDGTVSFEDYIPDEALERAVESALNDNSENIPELSNRESYRLGVYALKEWYEELK